MKVIAEFRQDAHYAARALRREPGVAIGIIITFALAIGANAAMFGLVGRLLLSAPPGVADAARVVRAGIRYVTRDGESYSASTTSYPAFLAMRAQSDVFKSVAAVRTDTVAVGAGSALSEISAIEASGDYFDVLGVKPLRGRFFSAVDDQLPNGSAVAVLSYRYWKREFAGFDAALNGTIVLNGEKFTVIGVAPAGFTGDGTAPTDVFIPLSAAMHSSSPSWASETGMNVVQIVGRLRDGMSPVAARVPATNAMRALLASAGRADELGGVEFTALLPGAAARETPQGRTALWLSGVAVVVLLIAIANVATLLLLRGLRRRREIAVRVALGVGRGRLVRQLLTESLILSISGGAAGLLVARWLSDLIRTTLLPGIAAQDTFVDPRVLAVTAIAACAAGVIAGCAPVLQLGRRDVIADLRSAGGATHDKSLLRGSLVGLQVALCTALLAGAGLFVKSLERVQSQDLGFSTSHLLYATLDFRTEPRGSERDRLHKAAAAKLSTLDGVTGVTVVSAMPFGAHNIPPISVPGMADPPSMGGQLPFLYGATPEYLRMMNARLLEGRLFSARDGKGTPLVAIVNETFAKVTWPGHSAIGRCIRAGFDPNVEPTPLAPASLPCREIVGVVRDSRARSMLPGNNEEKQMQYYVPFEQIPDPPIPDAWHVNGILVQTSGDPDRMASRVQQMIQGSSSVPVFARVRPYQDLLDPQLRNWRLGATLFSAFGMLALAIASVGLFGVVSYLAMQRTREIGVRLALGGTGSMIARIVIVGAVKLASIGIASGLLVAIAAAPLLQGMLFQTSARDAITLASAGALLLAVTVIAGALPAWRAARVSPLEALRAD